ncbi:MAG: tRNA preQ1(34) S-adenosylmethionine ribosyltransferase-isomerase QueA [Bacilli bacterium]|nr:tRNA preQ1(34) S-adenosylmethionine ribosyltransferase-isomerase QueA [Bacilli bacterium]
MDINLFDYYLPEELIAQFPLKKRDQCKLLKVDVSAHSYRDLHFFDILEFIKPGDVLVRNNTKVIPARLIGIKTATKGRVELILLKQLKGDNNWECLVGGAKAVKEGSECSFGEGKLIATCTKVFPEGIRHFHFSCNGIFLEVLEELGSMPLPPYIKKKCEDNNDYQTVYAKVPGSAAAPTAGFHFTEDLFNKIIEKGAEVVDVTLNIGLGTFRPVKVTDTKDHVMHSEEYEISKEAAEQLNKAKAEGRRIIAIGTTSVRTLESNISKFGVFKEEKSSTSIFISPGYEFKAIDALVTNFHLPKSTLIMLISAMVGRQFTLELYEHAVKEKYRFFSFGDAMFIEGKCDPKTSIN